MSFFNISFGGPLEGSWQGEFPAVVTFPSEKAWDALKMRMPSGGDVLVIPLAWIGKGVGFLYRASLVMIVAAHVIGAIRFIAGMANEVPGRKMMEENPLRYVMLGFSPILTILFAAYFWRWI